MDFFAIVGGVIFVGLVGFILYSLNAQQNDVFLTPEERLTKALTRAWGPINDAMVCPHCQTKGTVRGTMVVYRETSRTGGIVLGVTTKHSPMQAQQLHCDTCNATWKIGAQPLF